MPAAAKTALAGVKDPLIFGGAPKPAPSPPALAGVKDPPSTAVKDPPSTALKGPALDSGEGGRTGAVLAAGPPATAAVTR